MRSHDWLSRTHDGLFNQTGLTFGFLLRAENRDRMGFGAETPKGKWLDGVLVPRWTLLKAAYDDWLDPAERSPTRILRLTEAENALIQPYRKLYVLLKNDLFITDEDLIHMGFPVRGGGVRRRAPLAEGVPHSETDTSVTGRVSVHFFERSGGRKKAKPPGQHGAEMAWVLSDAPVTRWDELIHTLAGSASPLTLVFEHDMRGKRVFYALRWENSRGEGGPWSEIKSVIIP
jgi:hypothetical protein